MRIICASPLKVSDNIGANSTILQRSIFTPNICGEVSTTKFQTHGKYAPISFGLFLSQLMLNENFE